MIWDSTDSTLERDRRGVAAVELRIGAIRPDDVRSTASMHVHCTTTVSSDRSWRSRIPRNRESARCGTGFADELDRRDSRPACARVHEETEE